MGRALDILVSLMALVLLSPLMLMLIVATRLLQGSPVFFRQKRPGRHGQLFEMIKLKSMLDVFDDKGCPLPDVVRLTNFGKFLRSSSLDELPELWNVLKGDMSIVGPRPLLVEYLPLYNDEQLRRHDVKPGITGWAQVNGRNAISWDEKFKLDVWYVDNQSFWLDIKILFLTVKKVLMRDNISEVGHATAQKFKGNV